METPFSVTEGRHFSRVEEKMIWHKPASHQTSQEELRIASEIKVNWNDPEMKISNILLEGDAGSGKTQLAKALSYDLQLPYTKVTCFADMDKSDVFGALLPIVKSDSELDEELLAAIQQSESLQGVIQLIQQHYHLPIETARERLADFVRRVDDDSASVVQYKFYPSEIVRALEKGYLLEIQEPTVIRDASVLVALNSALEPNGMLNLPTGIIRRNPDCVVVITTNRNYQGNRPLNESLRDRMQHAEKMDLPPIEVMVERARGKTQYRNEHALTIMARIIRLLDETSKKNAIKGVAGMRSYFYWVNTVKQQQDPLTTLYPKVLYKLTTDPTELQLLLDALDESELLPQLKRALVPTKELPSHPEIQARRLSQTEADARGIDPEAFAENGKLIGEATEQGEAELEEAPNNQQPAPTLPEKKGLEAAGEEKAFDSQSQIGRQSDAEQGMDHQTQLAEFEQAEPAKKKALNKRARQLLKDTIHAKEGLIVHRPKVTVENELAAKKILAPILPIVDELTKQINELLENEQATAYGKGKYMGTRFDASRVAYDDYRTFDKKNPPHEKPSLALAIRVDESGSMVRDQRIESAKKAALAVNELARRLALPLMIYGDTADLSTREKTSLYSYKEFDESADFVAAKIMTMRPRKNNRDGVPLKILSSQLTQQPATTKLLLNISDGLPKAMPDYTGQKAKTDIQDVIKEYERQGVLFLAAAIGEDKDAIKEIYGEQRYLDISDLQTFPTQLIQLIARYL